MGSLTALLVLASMMPVFTGDLPKASYTKVFQEFDMDLPPGFIHNNHTHSHREYARVLLIFLSDTGLHAADRHVAAVLHHQHDDQHLHPHPGRLPQEI